MILGHTPRCLTHIILSCPLPSQGWASHRQGSLYSQKVCISRLPYLYHGLRACSQVSCVLYEGLATALWLQLPSPFAGMVGELSASHISASSMRKVPALLLPALSMASAGCFRA